MKYFLLVLICYAFAPQEDDNKKPSEMTDLELEGVKGSVKTITTHSGNTATYQNGAWIIKEHNAIYSVTSYNTNGNDSFTIYMLKTLKLRSLGGWTEDGLIKSLMIETGHENSPELSTFRFINDSTVLCKTFLADKDTLIQKLIEESITVYTPNGQNNTYFSIGEAGKKQESHVIQLNTGNDTLYSYYCEEDTTILTTIILEKDKAGNPTKTLYYTATDTNLSLKEYVYYD